MQAAWLFGTSLALTLGCAEGASVARCSPESWQGECQLASVTKVEDREFPTPYVVMESVYHPIANASHPDYTPGALAQRTGARAEYELALHDYLEANARVPCHTEAPQSSACVAPKVTVALRPFDPATAAPSTALPAVTGCAQIEATSTQDKLQGTKETQTFVSQRLSFAENSAELPPDAELVTADVAKLLKSKPSIECLGIVGQIASGEAPGLAEQRAKAVRDLLGAHGVPLTRLLTIGATAKVFGNGSRPAEPDPADRRVGFSVLLEHAPPPP
jgi:outer membrane protein OmpA-like peptidoglycan-associated protein